MDRRGAGAAAGGHGVLRVAWRGGGGGADRARRRGGAGADDGHRVRLPARCVRAHRSLGAAGRDRQRIDTADDLQDLGRVGEPRRLDAAVGDDPGDRGRGDRAVGETAAGAHAGADDRCAGADRAGLLRLPAVLVQSVRAAGVAAGGRQRLQPAVAGSGFGLPSADALHRLCRAVGGVLLRGGGVAGARRGAGVRARDAALGARRVDLPDGGDHRGQLLGLLRARLGRLVVLGSDRERQPDAVAGGDRPAPFGDGAGDARRVARLDDHAGRRRLLDEHGRHLSGALGHPHQRPRLRARSQARRLHPGAAGAVYRRRAGAVRRAGGDRQCGLALRRDEPRGRAGRQQPAAVGDPGRGADRHAVSARGGGGDRREAVGRPAPISTPRRGRWRCCSWR